ncbi:MAG: hypothetical protein KIT84_10225 [Labilithrix sp.]|nr:hypothetical protein [Labilithrix sp.]
MRLSSTSLLLAGALAAGAAMFNCAPEASEEPPSIDSAAITGTKNHMGLRLVYDKETSRVRATLRRPLAEDEKLRLQVRRGRLSAQSQQELDCMALPEAPAEPPSTANIVVGFLTELATVYLGPFVDPSLLATVYDERWIMQHVTPKMLEELTTRGADSIVEACVVAGDEVRARVQTSIAYAWDQSDPSLVGHSLLAAGGGNIASNNPIEATNHANTMIGRPIRSMEKYAELCVDELGEIPFFPKLADGSYDTFDCRDFTTGSGLPIEGLEAAMIPQSQHDASGNDTTPAECDDTAPGSANCWKTCDHPDWRSQTCEPGPTVASARNARGTHWTLLCRSPGDSTDSLASRKATKVFNDIAMIGHNPKTGKTCFFQNKLHEGKDGGHVTHPADVERAREIWDNPKGYCGSCHSADAFIHSPWIDQAKRSDGTPIVPMMGKHHDFEVSWLSSPYSIVNREAMSNARVGDTDWAKPKQLVSAEAAACLSCHRIGDGDGIKRFPMWSVGEEGIASTQSFGNSDGTIAHRYSALGAKFESTHWMPPRLDGLTEATFPLSDYAKAVAHIKKCATNEDAHGCVWADVPGE